MGRTLYYKGIQLPQLRSFCAVATQRSFGGAAKMLGISKPTVWLQVRALEREFKVKLLEQGGGSVELTPEGQLLLTLIQPHVSGLDSLPRLFEAQRAELQQSLTVASTPFLTAHHLPDAIQEFMTAHPSVRLHLKVETDEIVGLLERRQIDVGIVPFDPAASRNATVDYEILFDLCFTLVTACQHPLARTKQVRPHDLVQYPLIRGASHNQSALESMLRRYDLLERMRVVMDASSTDIIRKYVALGVGIAVLFLSPDDLMPGLHTRSFKAEVENLPVTLMTRKGAHQPEHVAQFCRVVRQHLTPKSSR